LLAAPWLPKGALVSATKAAWTAAWAVMVTELAPQSRAGGYVRPESSFTGVVSRAPGAAFPPDVSGRYVLYAGNSCPWCHRVTLTLALRGLSAAVRVVPLRGASESAGWIFLRGDPVVRGAASLRDTYAALAPSYAGRITAPLLVDATMRRIVSNDSASICRFLNDAFQPPAGSPAVELRPPALAREVDVLNEELFSSVNDGVYRCGFATTQTAYASAQTKLRLALEALDARLATRRFLHGAAVTESDVRLFATIVRLDAVYATLFKCAVRMCDYTNLMTWAHDFYLLPGVAATVDIEDYRAQYFSLLFPLNPGGLIPAGPTAASLGFGREPGRGGHSVDGDWFATPA
jgi:putative glutathione S-transferase